MSFLELGPKQYFCLGGMLTSFLRSLVLGKFSGHTEAAYGQPYGHTPWW